MAAKGKEKRPCTPSQAPRPKRSRAHESGAAGTASPSLSGLHFTESDGEKFVELASLLGKVCGRRGDKAMSAIWRQLGQDGRRPQVEGVCELTFSSVRGCARGSAKLAANLQGLQIVVQELAPRCLESAACKELLTAVARALGGEIELSTRTR